MSSPGSFAATSQARSIVYLIDLCAAATLLIPAAVAACVWGTPSAGALQFGAVFFVYHLYFLHFKNGCSLGKYIRNITVASMDGSPLRVAACVARAGSIALPWLLLGLADLLVIQDLSKGLPPGAIPTFGVAWLLVDLVCLECVLSRRTLTDRIAGTLVVNLPPLQPQRAPAAPAFSATDAEFGVPPRHPPSDKK